MLTLRGLKRYPRINRIHFLECAANSGMEWRGAQLNGCQYTHGMIHCVQYTGVPLRILLEEAGLKTNARGCLPRVPIPPPWIDRRSRRRSTTAWWPIG